MIGTEIFGRRSETFHLLRIGAEVRGRLRIARDAADQSGTLQQVKASVLDALPVSMGGNLAVQLASNPGELFR